MPTPTQSSVLVTAGASGIGHAIATAFSAAGVGVHVADIDADAVEKLNAAHPDIHTSVADVADEAAVEGVFARHHARFGGIEIMVNCAGIAGPTALLEEIELADWRRCVAVSLDATFLCCRKAIPRMRAAGKGCIINIASTAGWHGYPLRTPYASAKRGGQYNRGGRFNYRLPLPVSNKKITMPDAIQTYIKTYIKALQKEFDAEHQAS